MLRKLWVRATAAVVAAGVLATAALADPVRGVSGRWYTEGQEEGDYIRYLVDRADDGTYKAEIRVRGNCSPSGSWVQTGRWSFRDGTLYTRTETVAGDAVDSNSELFQDSFAVTVIDDDNVTMVDTETKITWSLRRVGADFRLPPDPACAV